MALGARIKQIREQRSIEQQDICRKIPGLSQQALSNLETRDSKSSEFGVRIADALGVSVRWLLDGSGEPDWADWPFPDIDRRRFDQLSANQKIEIQGVVRERIERFEDHHAPPAGKRTAA